ncbi:transcriptional regulator [Paenibacillus sp. TRM 82003]|nr:transcriptional regulator [Paenibacillus sp. TRM 82003]
MTTSSSLERLKSDVIRAISETMDLYGATPSVGQLYGVMFFEDKPMTLEEMKDVMGMSKSSMSYAVRTLMDSKMVYKLEEKQERKDLYVAEHDFYKAFQSFFGTKLQREIDVMKAAVEAALPAVRELILDLRTDEAERKEALLVHHKMTHALEYYAWLQQFVDRLAAGALFGEDKPET